MHYTVLGGRIEKEIDLSITGGLPVTAEKYRANMSQALDVPEIEAGSRKGRKIAFVAGGPSINQHVEALKAWDGEVWAVNGAYRWCMDRGIDATLIAIDPHPIVLRWAKGAHRAILGNTCDPEVFGLLRGADVRQIPFGASRISGTSSTATTVPFLTLHTDASGVTFFGCESSYEGDSHAYMHEARDDQIIVTVGADDFLTYSDFLVQARELSAMIRTLPGYLSEESGGLLRAMVESKGEHRIKWVSEAYAQGMSLVRPAAQAAD